MNKHTIIKKSIEALIDLACQHDHHDSKMFVTAQCANGEVAHLRKTIKKEVAHLRKTIKKMEAESLSRDLALKACRKVADAIETCPTCGGNGMHIALEREPCDICDGLGIVIVSRGLILSEAYPLALDAIKAAK